MWDAYLTSLVSICALLVWHPANPEEKIIRVLFPWLYTTREDMDGLERLKHLEFSQAACSVAPKISKHQNQKRIQKLQTVRIVQSGKNESRLSNGASKDRAIRGDLELKYKPKEYNGNDSKSEEKLKTIESNAKYKPSRLVTRRSLWRTEAMKKQTYQTQINQKMDRKKCQVARIIQWEDQS